MLCESSENNTVTLEAAFQPHCGYTHLRLVQGLFILDPLEVKYWPLCPEDPRVGQSS